MRIIIANSKTYGDKKIKVDDKNYDFLCKFNWHIIDNGGSKFYAVTNWRRHKPTITIRMHNLLMPYAEVVDHINGDSLDNREENLRPTTQKYNAKNRTKQSGRTSKYKGVWRVKNGNWMSCISFEGIKYHLGTFSLEEAAATAYNRKVKELNCEFLKLNNITEIENYLEYKCLNYNKVHKNIYYDKDGRRYRVVFTKMIDGKSKKVINKSFKQLEPAIEFAERMRNELFQS